MSKDWQAVAGAINTRLEQLDLSQKELAQRSKVSTATLRLLQKGTPAARSATTLAAVSTALGWASDHLERVAAGESSQHVPESDWRFAVQRLASEVDELRRRLDEVENRI